jgi:hypothetical protein
MITLPGLFWAITLAFTKANLDASASGDSIGSAVSSISGDCWLKSTPNSKPNVLSARARYLDDDPSIIFFDMVLVSGLSD